MIKSKDCIVEDCINPRFAKGYCKRHQNLREDKKPKPIKKRTEKAQFKINLKKELFKNDASFYLQIWEDRPHVCFETGIELGKMNLCMFHHVLPKQTYPEYRHCEWNIVLLHPDVHNQVETDCSKCPRVYKLTKELKEKWIKNQKSIRLENENMLKDIILNKKNETWLKTDVSKSNMDLL